MVGWGLQWWESIQKKKKTTTRTLQRPTGKKKLTRKRKPKIKIQKRDPLAPIPNRSRQKSQPPNLPLKKQLPRQLRPSSRRCSCKQRSRASLRARWLPFRIIKFWSWTMSLKLTLVKSCGLKLKWKLCKIRLIVYSASIKLLSTIKTESRSSNVDMTGRRLCFKMDSA